MRGMRSGWIFEASSALRADSMRENESLLKLHILPQAFLADEITSDIPKHVSLDSKSG
jgi:hypothetical protein